MIENKISKIVQSDVFLGKLLETLIKISLLLAKGTLGTLCTLGKGFISS